MFEVIIIPMFERFGPLIILIILSLNRNETRSYFKTYQDQTHKYMNNGGYNKH